MKAKIFCTIIIICLLTSNGYSFGPLGHSWVGAIADRLLAKQPQNGSQPNTAQKIQVLLKGMSLSEAANLPDKIKAWDRKPPSDPNSFHMRKKYAELEKQLVAFWKANPPQNDETKASHHWFHYTDISILESTYGSHKTGASEWDIVHMIPFCIRVLQGKESETNARRITKPVAVILLAHYLGDIHQPLHVGADFFDANGVEVNPDVVKPSFGDEGGNGITLVLPEVAEEGRGFAEFKMHGFWDSETVGTAFEMVQAEIENNPKYADFEPAPAAAQYLADKSPGDWQLPPSTALERWAEAWANEILPIAVQAHRRLKFRDIKIITKHGKKTAVGFADEKQITNADSYRNWSGKIVRKQIHKAGWRLTALLEQSLK